MNLALGMGLNKMRHGALLNQTTLVERNADIVKLSGYFALSQTYSLGLDSDKRSFCNMNNATRIRQTGTLSGVQTYLNDEANTLELFLDVWRRDGATWDRICHIDLKTIGIVNGYNNITFSPAVNVNEGDYIALSGDRSGTGKAISVVTTVGNLRYYDGAYPGPDNYNWLSATELANNAVSLHGLGRSPMIVGIGDSIIAGHGEHYSFCEVSTKVDLPNQILHQLALIDSNYVYQNMGIGGQRTSQILARFTNDVVDLKPKIALINGGVNDIAIGTVTKSQFLSNWTSLLDACLTSGIIPVACKILPWTNGTNTRMQTRDNWMADLKTLVNSYTGSVWVDFDQAVGQFRTGGDSGNLWDIQALYNDDGVHLNLAGYTKMAELIDAAIKTKYRFV